MSELSQYLVEELLNEGDTVTDYVVVYSGRFQPFHKGHYATYEHLVKKFGKDNVYIGTSDKTDKLKSPFNFKEKKTIMTKMFGIPSNKIVQVKNPYAPTEILKNYDENTTALITVVGEKDEQRLGGKYFTPYKGSVEAGYKDKGYVYASPAVSNPISGTDVRNWLGNGDAEERKKLFTKVYPKFDQKIFDLIVKKLDTLTEDIITETSSVGFGADDGEPETGYVSDGQKRVINGGKPEPWFTQGSYKQLEVPKGDYMRGKGKNKDKDSQFRKVTYKIANMETSTLKTAEKPEGVDKWKTVKPSKILKKEKRYWEMHESQEQIISNKEINEIADDMSEALGLAMGYPSKEQLAQKQKERDILRKKMDSQDDYYEPIEEDINLDVEIGDTILMGKFKNKKVVVNSIGKDEHGMPTINGKKVATFRILKRVNIFNNESTINEIPMDDLQKIDTYADKQMNPMDVVITDKHFFDRLTDPRNGKEISAAELTGFFKRLSKHKKKFVEFLKQYGQLVAKDNRTNINIPFMQKANKLIAKTIMRNDDYKTGNHIYKFEGKNDDVVIISKSLGVNRAQMPQINSKDIKDYLEFLKDKGIGVSAKTINVSKVGMTQKDINLDKVKALLGTDRSNLAKPVIISKDGYILDGHHRVVALYNIDKNFKLKTLQVDLGIKDLLNITKEYPKVSYKKIDEYAGYRTSHITAAAPAKGLDDSESDLYEGPVKGLYGGKIKIGGTPTTVEVELVGVDNKTKEFITKVIHIDKQFQSKLPIGSVLPIPARIFRTPGGGWYKIKHTAFEDVNETIKKVGDNEWAVYPKDGGDRLGTHKSYASALRQLHAIEMHKHEDVDTDDNIFEISDRGMIPNDGNSTTGYAWNGDWDDYDDQDYYLGGLPGWETKNKKPSEHEKAKSVDQTLPIHYHSDDKTTKYNRVARYGFKTPNEHLNEELITEGGAYGHMHHPFDIEMNLTFADLKNIVNKALTGDLEVAREKTDGQALAVSWVNGRLVAARNKSHLKNKGEGAMTIGQVADKFANRGGLTDAYNFAMNDLSKAIAALSEPQRKKIFNDGSSFMNLEVIYPTSVNVIPYNQPLLVFHGTFDYDVDGNIVGENQDAAKILAGMIKQVNAHVQSKYTIQGPPMQKLPKNEDLSKLQSKYMGMISKLQGEFKLADSAGVADYHQAWWTNFVDKNAKKLDAQQKIGLVKRWAFGDKGFRIANISDEKIRIWADGVDKKDQAKIAKENLMKFEEIFLGVGADVLSFMESVLTANPAEATKQMVARLHQTIADVKKAGDPKKVEKLKLELQRLQALGGFDKIVPNEGIVFVYNGNTYKLTGAFAPLNQILGLFY